MITNEILASDKEKRIHERHNCEAKIKWSYFNKDKFFDATIYNFSRNGIYFETSDEIKLKANIFIRLDILLSGNMSLDDNECLRTVALGEVKWCNQLSAKDVRYFGVGFRHYEVR